MWMVLLYGVATFMETGVGVWMFGRMFPERKSSSEYRWAKMILLTLLILTTYTMHRAYGQEYIYEKFFFIVVYAGVMISDAILYKYRDFFRINKKTEKIILFSYISIMLTWQYWVSYVSFGIIAIANLYLPFFLLLFYKCDFIQAYLWEVLYLVNIGLAKILYIYIIGMIKHRRIENFLFSKSVHFYAGVVYLLIFYVLFLIIQKNFCVEKWLKDLLTDCKKMILFVALSECSILYFLLTMNWGYIENRELIISFGVISGIALILLFVLARFWAKSIYTEKNILEVRNNVIASQYEELNESYKKYRCLIHDERHMMDYIEECIGTGNFSEAQKIIKKSRNKFSERYYWTGITILDNVISIEKRKMDNMNIEFHIETDVTDIVMEDIDIIILLENLFDNAIEAVEKCANKKEIKFSIKNINSMLVLKLWNSSCKKPKVKKERFVTDKHDSKGHGWGLESVKYIVKKYDGIIEFEYTEMFFQTVIMIEGE